MKKLALTAALALSLSACVTINAPMDVTSNNVADEYPIETAMLNIYTKARTQTLVATMDNQSIVADIKITPKGRMVFEGKQVQGTEVSTITKSNNQLLNQSVSINYYTLAPLTFQGYTSNSGEYSVATQTTAIPKMAKVGATQQLGKETVYSDSSKRTRTSVYNQSWSLTRDSNSTAWFCINSSDNVLLDVDPEGPTSECYKINTRGDILASRLTLDMPNQTIKFVSR